MRQQTLKAATQGNSRRRAPLASGSAMRFWDLAAPQRDWLLLAFGALCCGLLHLSPVLNSGLALPLTAAMAAACYLSPLSAFFFLGCNQFLPFSEGSAFNPAQIGVVVWLPVVFLRYNRVNLTGFRHFVWLIPWLGWHSLMTGENILHPNSEYFKAFVYAVIGLQMANEAKGRYLQCLFGLACGALMVGFAYWGITLGLPVQVSDWGGEREGFQRMGSVRADAVMVWPALLMGLGGLLGMAGAFASPLAKARIPKWLLPAVVGGVLMSLPPIAATMTHGAYAGLALIIGCFVMLLGLGSTQNGKKSVFATKVKNALTLGALLAVVLFVADAFQMRSRTEALERHYDLQKEEMGTAASRTGVWSDALDTIFRYPVTGYIFAGGAEQITSEYAATGSYLAHNVFLDYGRSGGIPGILFVSLFFFIPAYRLWNHELRWQFMPFLMVFIAALTFWMTLSFQFYKTIWALWPLMMRAGDLVAPIVRVPRKKGKNHSRKQWNTESSDAAATAAAVPIMTSDEPTERPAG
jgi:hypothetical protein